MKNQVLDFVYGLGWGLLLLALEAALGLYFTGIMWITINTLFGPLAPVIGVSALAALALLLALGLKFVRPDLMRIQPMSTAAGVGIVVGHNGVILFALVIGAIVYLT